MFERILVPTDGSSTAECAAGAAIELARACGSKIVALSVAGPAPIIPSAEGAMVVDAGQQAEVLLEHAQDYAAALAERVRRAGIDCTVAAKMAPDPARAIVEAVREHNCTLIVMGSHGRRGLRRLLAGSVTQAVLADAPVPVMVLRPGPAAGAPAS